MSSESLPTLRWGIIATGQISSWFVRDLSLSRPDAKARHTIAAIGSSSQGKGEAFVKQWIPDVLPAPKVYAGYEQVYNHPDVDIIYIGTPHAFHKQNCLAAIAAGKHVLCEKAFTLNARDAKEVFAAAENKGVFVMEALWTRFFPLVQQLQRLVHEENVIGSVHRVFADLGLDQDFASLGPDSRLRNPALGAGTLLDICIYSLTWGLLALDAKVGEEAEKPVIKAVQTLFDSIDVASTVVLYYPSTGRQAICTSTAMFKTPDLFCRIEGTNGYITVEGVSASRPSAFTIYAKDEGTTEGKRYTVANPGFGLFWEADAIAHDIAAGRKESAVMPWAETIRVMEMMDEARRQGGARFPVDD
ncbi:NAD(P)-binding protein [Trematosphaeria pertusa]|uniref:D-xylose 1-dehydrogenase (NADP(+), D-xylono-1,5-lactone-forming) n=1 Tax=Trematosphaeria pertusa TaxID=390896 RepID=A0A6A6ILB6_9PLEO|nr:NAD(P)-binding protein [Trematosphaeria pertusa]KAF2251221.1 NAD(P)-binding protein [Trematosphaeria pertusa]